MASKMAFWVQEDLSRKGAVPFLTSAEIIHGELETPKAHAEETHCQSHQGQEAETPPKAVVASLVFENSSQKLQDDVVLVTLLKTCAKDKDLCKGSRIHADVLRKGTRHAVVGTSLLNMYVRCGSLAKAQQVFDELPMCNVFTWTALLAGYTEYGRGELALNCFEQMLQVGLFPDAVTYGCVLRACGAIGAVEKGKEIHFEIATKGLLGENVKLGTALVDMYAKHGALAEAQQVLDQLPCRNVISWNALITGYCQHARGEEALECFDLMKREGISPSEVTFACILKACGSIGAAEKGKEIHFEIVTKGLLQDNPVLGSALIYMYANCGALTKARQVFDGLPVWDVVLWTALITGYCQHGCDGEALSCLERMKRDGFFPNAVTFSCILKACGNIRAAEKGKELHAEVVKKGLLRNDIALGNALVYMYAKCGILAKAQEVFDELCARNVVSWSALIAGYCERGHGEEALNCFECMKREGLSPDAVAFSGILKACGTIGAVDKGQTYFESMSTSYGIIPSFAHHTCMVDLFSRGGQFDKAMTFIEKMPSLDYLPVWLALLGACRKWGNFKLGRLAFDHAVRLD